MLISCLSSKSAAVSFRRRMTSSSSTWLNTTRLLRARALQGLAGRRIPGYGQATRLAWRGGHDADPADPDLVIFLSHRWRSSEHPDPDGRTLRALVRLLDAMDALARGLDPAHPDPVPSLQAPAMLQAMVLVHRLLERTDHDGARALDRVAIFVDHACLPQGRSAGARQRLKNGLASFPQMLPDPRVALVALRHAGDGYDRRSWCVAESALALHYDENRPWAMTFPLRMDLEPRVPEISYEPLRTALAGWTGRTCGRARISADEFRSWLDLVQHCVDWHTESRDGAMTVLHHSPAVAEQSFKLWIRTTLRLAECGDHVVDLVPLVCDALTAEGLHCTDPDDALPTGLLILAAMRWEELNRNAGAPGQLLQTGADFWRSCLQRHLSGQALLARVRQRESRKPGQLVAPALELVHQG